MKRFLLGLVTATMFLGCSSDDSSNSSDDNPSQITMDLSSLIGTWEIRKVGDIDSDGNFVESDVIVVLFCGEYKKWVFEGPVIPNAMVHGGPEQIRFTYKNASHSNVTGECQFWDGSFACSSLYYAELFNDRSTVHNYNKYYIQFQSLSVPGWCQGADHEIVQKDSNTMTVKSRNGSSAKYLVKVD